MVYAAGQWSFPGGGIDEGESSEEAIVRELSEELNSDKFKIVGKSQHQYKYEWPDRVVEEIYQKKGLYQRGTQLDQFWISFLGNEDEVTAGDGIREIKWVKKEKLEKYLKFLNQLENAEKVILEFSN